LLILGVVFLTLAAVGAANYITSKLSERYPWGELGEPNSLRFSPDYSLIAVDTNRYGIGLWDVSNKRMLRATGDTSLATQLVFSPDGRMFAWSNEEYVLFYNLRADRLVYTPAKARGWVYAMAISPARSALSTTDILATGGRVSEGANSAIELWNILGTDTSRYTVAEFQSGANVFSLGFSQDGNLLAAGLSDGNIGVWQISADSLHIQIEATQVLTATSSQRSVDSIAISPDNQVIAAGDTSSGITLLSVQDGRILQQISTNLQHQTLVFSPDSRFIAAGQASTDGERKSTVSLWNVSDGTLKWSSDAHPASMMDLRFSPDGKELTAGYSDGTLQKYSLP
jgi:WD40 repeat protein